jgi:hypothetical protein
VAAACAAMFVVPAVHTVAVYPGAARRGAARDRRLCHGARIARARHASGARAPSARPLQAASRALCPAAAGEASKLPPSSPATLVGCRRRNGGGRRGECAAWCMVGPPTTSVGHSAVVVGRPNILDASLATVHSAQCRLEVDAFLCDVSTRAPLLGARGAALTRVECAVMTPSVTLTIVDESAWSRRSPHSTCIDDAARRRASGLYYIERDHAPPARMHARRHSARLLVWIANI